MPDVLEPGTRLVGRYRLEAHLGGPTVRDGASSVTTTGGSQVKGATYWRAHDELLDRPVAVCLLRSGSSYAERVLDAARRAAVLTDARFLRVLDAAEVDGLVYVVSEWVPATSLVDLLADGPLGPAEARALAADITGALAAAHEAGLDHLSLQPKQVLRTSHGQVKLAGLAVDAAARGLRVDDPAEAARRDAEGAASVLYAALTARWPGEERTGLAPAPRDGDALCSPRQVRAGIPDDLDDLVSRALAVPGRHGGPPLRTVEEMAAALASSQVTSRLAVPETVGARGYVRPDAPPYDLVLDDRDASADGPRGPRASVIAWAVVVVVLLAGVALAGGQMVRGFGGGGSGSSEQPAGGAAEQAKASGPTGLEVERATAFDPPPGNGDEHSDEAPLAVDGDRRTSWTTMEYYDPFGPGFKRGVGLLLDLGRTTDLAQVTVLTRGGATDLEVRVADQEGDSLRDYRLFDEASNVDGRVALRPDESVSARYVVIWLTSLPTVGDSVWQGEIAEVGLRG